MFFVCLFFDPEKGLLQDQARRTGSLCSGSPDSMKRFREEFLWTVGGRVQCVWPSSAWLVGREQGGVPCLSVIRLLVPTSLVSTHLFSHLVVPNSLWPHGLQHAKLPRPSPSPGVWSDSCPLSWWCHPTTLFTYLCPTAVTVLHPGGGLSSILDAITSKVVSQLSVAAAAKSLQSCPTLCDPIDGRPPGSPVPGILQSRTWEWVAISFSNAWKWKMKVKSLSRVRLFATLWTAAYQAPGKITGVGCYCLLQK